MAKFADKMTLRETQKDAGIADLKPQVEILSKHCKRKKIPRSSDEVFVQLSGIKRARGTPTLSTKISLMRAGYIDTKEPRKNFPGFK